MILFLVFSRILLNDRKMIEPIKGGKISKHEGHWYYVKCTKKQTSSRQCSNIIKSSLLIGNDISKVGIPMRPDLYSVYMTREEAEKAIKLQLKLQKIPKAHKTMRGVLVNGTNQFLVISTPDCELPYKVQPFGLQGQLFETDLSPIKVFDTLSKIRCVRSFEHVPQSRLNTRFTRTIAHNDIPMYYNQSDISFTLRNLMHEHGIGGHGQVVSIVDTGLDANLCWFSDPDQPNVVFEDSAGIDHRKILSYFRYADDKDFDGGHGTFISSIIAGQAVCGNDETFCAGSLYDGVAPMAKIIMNDVHKANQTKYITWPKNLTDLFIIPRFMSAAVQYHAFDFQMQSYFTYLMDQIAFYFPQMLLLFAAGEATVNGQKVITSPGDSKNVLTVGSTQSAPLSLNQIDPASPVIVVNKGKDYIGFCDPFAGITWMEATSRPELYRLPLTYEIGNSKNQFVLDIEDTKNDINENDQNKNDNNNNNKNDDEKESIEKYSNSFGILSFHTNEYKGKLKRPVIRLPKKFAKKFSVGDTITIKPFEENHLRHSQQGFRQMSAGSRGGPVRVGRIKPDIVMPGGPALGANAGSRTTNINDKTKNNKAKAECGPESLRVGEGTSVAAAFAAGDIMLIRQYLKHGFYPSGVRKKENSIKTSNHMVKAILANIAEPVTSHEPDAMGFGMPQLGKFIIFPDTYHLLTKKNQTNKKATKTENADRNYGFRFFSDKIKPMSYHAYRFKAQEDGPLVATISWNDPPHDMNSPSDVLFRMDLRIEDNMDSPQRIGNRRDDDSSSFDVHNTVKRIRMTVKRNTIYMIYVVSGDLLHYTNCSYTIAISAPFDHFNSTAAPMLISDSAPEPKCGSGCEGSGSKCRNGYCVCPEGRIGAMCASEAHPMKSGMKHEEDPLRSHEAVYYTFKIAEEWTDGSVIRVGLKVDDDMKKKKIKNLFYMFSINEAPSWETAHCAKGTCPWIEENQDEGTVSIEYAYWDFLKKGDVIHFAIYSFDETDFPVTVSFKYEQKIEKKDEKKDEN